MGSAPPPPRSTTLISRGSTTILSVPCRLRWARVYKDLCEVELTVYRVMRGVVLAFRILCKCFQLQRIRSNGIRSKGRRSNVSKIPQEDILLFENNKMNDQNQLPLEIYQDQWIHLKALKSKRSGYYKNWPSETSWKNWAGTPLRLNHWKIWKKLSKSSKSIVMLLPICGIHIIDRYFSLHIWYKSYVRMVGQGGQKDYHYSLSTNLNCLHHHPHEIDQYYHKYHHHQYSIGALFSSSSSNSNNSIFLQDHSVAPPSRISDPAEFIRSERCSNCTWGVFNFTLNFSWLRTFLVHIGI